MTLPRFRVPGHLKLVLRYTVDEQPWLSLLSRDEIAYSLGHASGDTGVVVHAALIFDNCCALLVTDSAGLLSHCTQRLHTSLTELTNRARGRKRGTIWDNRKPAESFVVDWSAAQFAIGLLAVRAANAVDSDDAYDCPGYFGPELWGTLVKHDRPERFNARSTRPATANLNLKAPDCAPKSSFLEDLVAELDQLATTWVAESRSARRGQPAPDALDASVTREFGEFIGPDDVVEMLASELAAWRAYYERCRIDFKKNQLVAFPAGTLKFRELGAATDPCPTYIAPAQPRRRPPRPPPG